jgi:hypothetical protein
MSAAFAASLKSLERKSRQLPSLSAESLSAGPETPENLAVFVSYLAGLDSDYVGLATIDRAELTAECYQVENASVAYFRLPPMFRRDWYAQFPDNCISHG